MEDLLNENIRHRKKRSGVEMNKISIILWGTTQTKQSIIYVIRVPEVEKRKKDGTNFGENNSWKIS